MFFLRLWINLTSLRSPGLKRWLCIYFSFTWTYMEVYGQFPKLLRSLVDDVEDSESLADDDDATKKRG